ncbi:MAG: hypothetical protein IT376_08395 [Polyangiaceae bacterium]|nr:hypothetical protein [Polyangiaceae bacterium]
MPRRSSSSLRSALAAVALLGASCEREKPPPPRTEPWPAQAQDSGAPAVRHGYEVAADAAVTFELPVPAGGPRGRFRVARGSLEIAPDDLARTTGTIELDVASVLVEGADVAESRQRSQVAQSWLDVGASRPEVERERLRWARFRLKEITRASAQAAWAGRAVSLPAADAAAADATPDGGPAAPAAEVAARSVELEVRGDLELHGRRIEQPLGLRVTFYFSAPPAPGVVPSRVVLDTPQPFTVALATFDIAPRDARGARVAADEGLLGKAVGRSARTRVERVELLPRPPR